jgi:hypothetical protein
MKSICEQAGALLERTPKAVQGALVSVMRAFRE